MKPKPELTGTEPVLLEDGCTPKAKPCWFGGCVGTLEGGLGRGNDEAPDPKDDAPSCGNGC